MQNPIVTVVILLAVILLVLAWKWPAYALIPAVLMSVLSALVLWGMTSAMPRAVASSIPEGNTAEYREGYYDGAIALAGRQRSDGSVAIWAFLASSTTAIILLSLTAQKTAIAALKNKLANKALAKRLEKLEKQP